MSHVTQTRDVTSDAALEIADPAKNLILVPLGQLLARRSKRNARRSPRQSIAELAASIGRVGLLQNLIVIATADGEHYEVVAGDRRLTALKLLAKKKRIAPEFDVPCLLVADASARTVSLAENLLKQSMHPADEFEAFAALVREGRPVEDIAADFGVSPLVVQRRLKLANVSPRLMADYRSGSVTLEQLMALTITDDHAVQESVFYGTPDWQRNAPALRARLTERDIDATDARARFVGLDAYVAAGGGVRRDLFATDEDDQTLTDAALLDTLVRDKLASLAEAVRAEGWAWVEAVPHLSFAERQVFHTAPVRHRDATRREARRIASLQHRLDALEVKLEAAFDAEDEERVEALQPRRVQIVAELDAIENALKDYAPDVLAIAGAIVTLDRDGQAIIHRGLLREAEARALQTLERLRQGFNGNDDSDDEDSEAGAETLKVATVSDRLAQRLSAHRTAALQIEVARHPHVALAALVHDMVHTVLQPDIDADDVPLGVRLSVPDRLEGLAPDWPESPAAVALREARQVAREAVTQDGADLFTVLRAKSQDELVRLLAVCVASTVDVVTPRATPHQPGVALAEAVGLDMAAWWKPTADGYFQHIAKAAILEAVKAFAPSQVHRLVKLKKADLAREAERLAEGTGWMPPVFGVENSSDTAAPDGAAPVCDDAPETMEGEDQAQAHALAA
ncbi:putative plasmid stabilization protein [Candidatus Burkholderia verschuerenii]|uniref:Putative plasmid stabilization protein n=1 Tax=Candidatus Burkholderia verschuerenii TaxID=242163 RepID=A0A0L0MF40_9BURK|nr:ParB/RepB/Spo0J family partition protein [Candidatus Burkholderia verschuerenii]KND60953.1 putative plasmid stabilization protein [Candidatus Burkholderia verschuerenii]